jgi:hypothetical protein
MFRKAFLVASAFGLLGAVSAPAYAGTATLQVNTWYSFYFGADGTPLLPGLVAGDTPPDGNPTDVAPSAPWTIFLSSGQITIVDVESPGDQFSVTAANARGDQTVTTSTPTENGDWVGECISCALSDPAYSQATFALKGGLTTISGTYLGASPYAGGYGQGEFEITGMVPEPSTWAIMLIGLAAIGAGLRSRRKIALTADPVSAGLS